MNCILCAHLVQSRDCCAATLFCSRECLEQFEDAHPLSEEKVFQTIEAERDRMKANNRLNDADQKTAQCFICLENGTIGGNELYDPMCGCSRSNNSVMHLPCFLEHVQKEVQKKYEYPEEKDELYWSLDKCDSCRQIRGGIIRLELNLKLYELHVNKYVITRSPKDLNDSDIDRVYMAHKYLASLLIDIANAKYVYIKLLYRMLDILEYKEHRFNPYYIVHEKAGIYGCIGDLFIEFGRPHEGFGLLRLSYYEEPSNEHKCVQGGTLALRLVETVKASNADANNFDLLNEAKKIMVRIVEHDASQDRKTALTIYHRYQLAEIFSLECNYDGAYSMLQDCFNDSRRLLGPSHAVTDYIGSFIAEL